MRHLTIRAGFEKCAKATRRKQFLVEMDPLVSWGKLCPCIAPNYPGASDGRPPNDLEMMLCIYYLQLWFNLSELRHGIGVITHISALLKVRYRVLEKSATRPFAPCALANLYLARSSLQRFAPV